MGDPVSEVPCGGCTLCCRDEVIYLFPERGDDWSKYQTRPMYNPLLGHQGIALQQRPDGSCVYLGEGGCTIWADRPIICRSYSCIDQYLRTPRAERRRRERADEGDGHSKRIFNRGRELAIQTGAIKE